ncbi:hypothetical protein [Flavobacterium panacagri]|uniref:hypothetical protein n=1 Tax=Flavobacterium panacagri TaxID=3034146 RepID=UPI0025A5FA99|nr:hypothetical protein [Flavobacterium panacagri]
MNTKFFNSKTPLLLSAFALISLLTSCDNEEERWTDVKEDPITEIVTDLDARRIISFKVINPGENQAIYSAVNNLDRTITVYLPSYYEYEYLEASITLPEKTTISPATTELVPVFAKTPFLYTTKAADGSTAIYTVKVVIQQPKLVLNELSTETTTYSLATSATLLVKGENFIPSYEVTKVYAVDAQGNKKWQFQQYNDGLDLFSFSGRYSFGTTATNVTLEANTDYWIQMESYNLTAKMKYPIRFTK